MSASQKAQKARGWRPGRGAVEAASRRQVELLARAGGTARAGTAGFLPRWACLMLAALCAGLGGWASVVTLRYFEYGARALEADEGARALASATALLLVVLEMAAFALAALLPRERLRAQRWGLAVLATAVLAFECMTIVLVQQGITRAADVGAEARQQRAQELRSSIAALRATAEELRMAAAASSQSKVLASRQSAAESLNVALETERRIQAVTAELGVLLAQQTPTATQILGERGALAYAVTRGLLVSVAGLVLFGAAGSLLRAAGENGTETVSGPAVGVSGRGVPGVSADTSGVSVGAPPIRFSTGFALAAAPLAAGAVVPATVSWAEPSRGVMVPAGPAPAVPAPAENRSADVSVGVSAGVLDVSPAPVSGVAVASMGVSEAVSVSEPAAAGVSVAAADEPVPPPADGPDAPAPEAAALDAVDAAAEDARLARVRAGVRAGRIAPSIRGVQAAVHCGAPMVRRYLAQLEAEGLIRRDGRGYVRVEEEEIAA
ncbi:hypothetical protein [Azohydromonas caseinilytica]|uniref:Uncharacterized protein n=1 Tax=Azohydromonas caseinilytica TaxID=2728836 RepID=A0A848F902_9BURK|nr:hypothetical protein [Azohydromonas caseinilytica]NML14511.1 hypothetical protein [Azohydromonas caseinilytica]